MYCFFVNSFLMISEIKKSGQSFCVLSLPVFEAEIVFRAEITYFHSIKNIL